jgi:hypothetical protein
MAEDDLLVRVGITEKQYLATLARMEKQSVKAASSAEKAFAKSNKAVTRSASNLNRATTNSSHSLRMMSMQLSQVAQQGAATGDYLRALAIQIPDLALGLGTVGIAAGALAPILLSLFQGMDFGSKGAQNLEEAMEALEEVTKRLQQPLDVLSLNAEDLAVKYGEAADRVRDFAIFQGELRVEQANQLLRDQVDIVLGIASAYVTSSEEGLRFDRTMQRIQEDFKVSRGAAMALEAAFQEMFTAGDFAGQQIALEKINNLLRDQNVNIAEIPPEIARALDEMITYSNEVDAARALAETLSGAMDGVTASTASAADEATRLARMIQYATQLNNNGLDVEDPRNPNNQRPIFDGETGTVSPFDPSRAPKAPTSRGGGGGASKTDALVSRLEQIEQSLMTEEALQIAAFERQQETLQQALEQQLLTRQEYNELTEAAQRQHADKMAQIDALRYGTGVQKAGAFFGQMADAFAQGTDKMQRIASAFAAVESLINAYRAYNQVLADPSLPFFAKVPAAASVLAAGLNAVSAIKGAGSSGGGAAGSAAVGGAQVPNVSRNVAIQLEGDFFSGDQIRKLINAINEETEGGAIVRLV